MSLTRDRHREKCLSSRSVLIETTRSFRSFHPKAYVNWEDMKRPGVVVWPLVRQTTTPGSAISRMSAEKVLDGEGHQAVPIGR